MTIDTKTSMRNVLMLLQADPKNYRRFGVYWYQIKALLKQYYTTDNLYLLGDYKDSQVPAPVLETEDMLREAFDEYARNTAFNLGSSVVQDIDGQDYALFDQDAGV